jgi:hypothetical protein
MSKPLRQGQAWDERGRWNQTSIEASIVQESSPARRLQHSQAATRRQQHTRKQQHTRRQRGRESQFHGVGV